MDNLAAILSPGGNYFMLCFSDLEPAGYGPRRITKREIQDNFRDGWTINYIRPAIFGAAPGQKDPCLVSSIAKKTEQVSGPPAWMDATAD